MDNGEPRPIEWRCKEDSEPALEELRSREMVEQSRKQVNRLKGYKSRQ